MFGNLSKKLSSIFSSIRKKTILTKDDIKEAMKEIRTALLDADVALEVVETLTDKIEQAAIGENVIKSISPEQLIVKIVYDNIVSILSDDKNITPKLDRKQKKIMLIGLQGSGKTTTAAKLVHYFTKNDSSKKSLLTSVDIYRPAAIEQLSILASSVGADFTKADPLTDKPMDILKRALSDVNSKNLDLSILDTAGRLHTDEKLLSELIELKTMFKPDEVFLVVDAMTGQDSINIAKEFHNKVGITGIILSRIDADPRGGVALSMKTVTSVPIIFMGVGEKLTQIELFDPKKIASRILDMGDIVSLVEQATEAQDENDAKIAAKMQNGNFDLNDFSYQLKKINKMGGLAKLMQFLPNFSNISLSLQQNGMNESFITKNLAIISSMTKIERENPQIIKNSRKLRISSGSGTSVQEVNKLLKHFEQMQLMVKKMKNMPSNLINSLMNKIR